MGSAVCNALRSSLTYIKQVHEFVCYVRDSVISISQILSDQLTRS